MREPNRYGQIIERIFLARYQEGVREIIFEREDLVAAAEELQIKLPKNLGDVIYSFRYRVSLPEAIQSRAWEGEAWIIRLWAVPGTVLLRSQTVPSGRRRC